MPAYAKQDTKSQKLKAKQWSRKKMAQNLKSVYYYCRGPSFSFQHPHSSSHPQLQFLGAITPSSGLHRHCTYLYMVDKNLKQTDIHTYIHINYLRATGLTMQLTMVLPELLKSWRYQWWPSYKSPNSSFKNDRVQEKENNVNENHTTSLAGMLILLIIITFKIILHKKRKIIESQFVMSIDPAWG